MSIPSVTSNTHSVTPFNAKPSADLKITHCCLRILRSPLFYALVLTATAIVMTAVMAHMYQPDWLHIAVPVACGGGLIFMGIVIRFHKRTTFETTLYWSLLTLKSPHNEITSNIVGGRLPLKTHQDYKKLKDDGVGAVLGMVEDHEYNHGMGFEPIQKEDWNRLGIAYHQIKAADFKALTREQIIEGVNFLNKMAQMGNKTYVHCKAGRGRSMTIVVCYLLYTKAYLTVDTAISAVKTQRPDLHFNSRQKAAIQDYWEYLCTSTS